MQLTLKCLANPPLNRIIKSTPYETALSFKKHATRKAHL